MATFSSTGENYTSVRPGRLVHLGVARTFQTVRLLPRHRTVQHNIQLGADARTAGAGRAGGPAAKLKAGRGLASPAVAGAIARTG